MSCGIYKITNLINGKIYVGQSVNIEKRWQDHKIKKDNFAIHLAFKKYGIENFSFEIIEECSQEILDEREIYWIHFYNSFNKGYNETIGGGGNPIYDQLEIESLWEKGYSTIEIATKIGCTNCTIINRLKGYGNFSIENNNIRSGKRIAVHCIELKKDFSSCRRGREIFKIHFS